MVYYTTNNLKFNKIMIIINNETYVSLEIDKLLKQAGFNLKCRIIQIKIGEFKRLPTLAVAQKWLREMTIWQVEAICVYKEHKKLYSYCVFHDEYKNQILEEDFKTYEEAVEAGIKKVLELILNKIK